MQGVAQCSDPSHWELWRCRLCAHGPTHGLRFPECRFAHSLSELRRPDERQRSYAHQWEQGKVDRFYGQRLYSTQIDRIRRYYNHTPICEVPVWAIGLFLIDSDLEKRQGYAYPWDFGLVGDYDHVKQLRVDRSFPCSEYPGLWRRLRERHAVLRRYRHPPHALGVNAPRAIAESQRGQEWLDGAAQIQSIQQSGQSSSSHLAPMSIQPSMPASTISQLQDLAISGGSDGVVSMSSSASLDLPVLGAMSTGPQVVAIPADSDATAPMRAAASQDEAAGPVNSSDAEAVDSISALAYDSSPPGQDAVPMPFVL